MNQLRLAIVRKVERVVVLALHGSPQECGTVREAIDSIRSYTITQVDLPFTRWEISIKFVNGDRIEAAFRSADDAINCLGTFA